MRLILKLALALSIAMPSVPTAANAQYFLSETDRQAIWRDAEADSLRKQRQNFNRLRRAEERAEYERARNYFDGVGGGFYIEQPRYRKHTRRNNGSDAFALGLLGLATGVIVGGALAAPPARHGCSFRIDPVTGEECLGPVR